MSRRFLCAARTPGLIQNFYRHRIQLANMRDRMQQLPGKAAALRVFVSSIRLSDSRPIVDLTLPVIWLDPRRNPAIPSGLVELFPRHDFSVGLTIQPLAQDEGSASGRTARKRFGDFNPDLEHS